MMRTGGTRQSEVSLFNMAGIAVKFLSTLRPIGTSILSDVTLSKWRDLNDRSARRALPPALAAAYGAQHVPHAQTKMKSKRLKNIKRNKT
jgi:hypothetical protein